MQAELRETGAARADHERDERNRRQIDATLRAMDERDAAARARRQIHLVGLGWLMASAMLAVTAVGLHQRFAPKAVSDPTNLSYIYSCGQIHDPQFWFNPSWILDIAHACSPIWQIGRHTYTTRDVMGRKV